MRTIWKYPLKTPTSILEMPIGSKVLTCQKQGEDICIWASHTEGEKEKEMRLFRIIGTGQKFDDGSTYIGTVQEGPFVWHIFEITSH